jgi:hypothetical protein
MYNLLQMNEMLLKHKRYWKQKYFLSSFFFGVLLFAISLIFNHCASDYVDYKAGSYVQDIILDNLPVINIDWIINEGVIIFSIFIILFSLTKPEKMPFALKGLALFVTIRAIFTTLTHLGPAPSQTYLDPNDLLIRLNSGRDMFFSGHTGMPFFLALVFWKDKLVRYISITASAVFGASVLLGHLHYSIDVFAAFFITYSIYHLAQIFFSKDYALSQGKV